MPAVTMTDDCVAIAWVSALFDPEVCLEQYAHGGMSSGMISLDAWRQRLMPLLAGRARALLPG